MAHHTTQSGYQRLGRRVNKFPQGAPPSDLLFRIFGMLFSDAEASLLAQLPLRPFTARKAARAWKMSVAEAEKMLDGLADRALILDTEHEGKRIYVLPPPMAGFFEFSMMRVRGDLDQKTLAELFYQYLNVEDGFVTALFGTETPFGRAFVHEPSLPAGGNGDGADGELFVLDHERASEIVRAASHRGVSICYCRHKMGHLERACDAPLELCLSFDFAADSLARHGYARVVDTAEALDLLAQAWELGLLQFGENVRRHPKFICNCCGCCCEALLAAQRFAVLHPVHTTSFLPRVDEQECSGCGRCLHACPVGSMSLVSAGDPWRPKAKRAWVDEQTCLGCGLCVRACANGGVKLVKRAERVLTPVTTAHRVVLQAIERGTLQYLVFDQQGRAGHRAMAAVLGVILKLPPLQQGLASRQLKSRYLERILDRRSWGY